MAGMAGMESIHGPRQDLFDRTVFNLTLQPIDANQGERMDKVRRAYKEVVGVLVTHATPGRELSMSLTALEDSCQYAIASIARENRPEGYPRVDASRDQR